MARIREAGRRLTPGPSPEELNALKERFFDALARDFNTAEALAVLNEWLREATGRFEQPGDSHLREMLWVLGLDSLLDADEPAPEAVRALAQQREAARSARDFQEADRLRDEIARQGWEVRDGAGGFELLPL